MTKNEIMKKSNTVLAAVFVLLTLTGMAHQALPHSLFSVLHGGCAILMVVGTLVHVVLNWPWIKSVYFKKEKITGQHRGF